MAPEATNVNHAEVEGVQVDVRHWIGGRRVASAQTFPDVSPIDEVEIAQVHAGGADEVDQAVAAARAAFPAWAAMSVAERSAILRRVADGVEARVEELARVETRDNGSLLRSHRRGVMPRVAMNFRYFADFAEELAHPDMEVRGHRERISYDPAGVVAIITPWNAPADAGHLEDRAGDGGREHRGAQAAGVGTADREPAGRHHGRGRGAGRGLQRRAGHRGRGGRTAVRAPRHQPTGVHRVRPHRRPGGGSGRAEHRPALLRAGRQVAAARLRGLRHGPGGEPHRGAVRQRRAGLPGRLPRPGPRVGRRGVHRRASSSGPVRSCRATRGTRAPTSAPWSRVSTSTGSAASSSAPSPTAPSRSWAVAPTTTSAACSSARRSWSTRSRAARS